jgi:hypothetical protein
MQIRSAKKSQPSYRTGYAKSASESAHPELWDGLVGAWMPSFGSTGGTLRDVSGNRNHGTLTGMDSATDWVASEKGLALDFDGTDDYVQTSDITLSAPQFTISSWVKFDSTSGTPTIACSSHYYAIGYDGNFLLRLSNSQIQFVSYNGQSDEQFSGNAGSVTSNRWYHIVVTGDGTNSKIYKDGIRQLTFTQDKTLADLSDGGLLIGDDISWTNEPLNGQVANALLYKRALTEREILDLHADPLAPFRQRRSIPFGVTPTPTESHPSNGLIRLKSPRKSQPSYKTGYAKSASESSKPHLWEGMVGAWAPNLGISGDSLRDVSCRGSHAVGDNFDVGTDWGITEVGPALTLSGDGNEGMLTDVGIDDLIGSGSPQAYVSMAAWVKVNSSHQGMILAGSNGGAARFYIETFATGNVFHWGLSASQNSATSNAVYTIGKWHHYVVTRDVTTVRSYLDGVLVDTDTGITGTYTTNPISIGYYDTGTLGFDGDIGLVQIYNRPLRGDEVAELAADPMGMFRQRRSIPFGVTISGAQAYTLTADTGAFNLTGNDATLTGPAAAYTLTADTGSFTLTGNDADPDADRQLVAATGAYTLSGTATDLDADRQLTASTGAYTLTGNDAILTKSSFAKFVVDTGTFTLTGNDTGLKADHDVAASTGSYTLTGSAAGLPADRQLAADTASFSLTGNDATLTYAPTDPTLTAATGSFTETGNDATLTVSRKLTADTTSYTVAGNDTATKASHKFLATVASFDLDGPAVNLELSRRIALDTLTYNLTGVNTRLSYSEEDVSSIIQATSASIRCPQANGSISCADSDGTFVTP